MPMIPVRCACGVCPEEWAIIELQGSVEIQPSALHQKLETLTIGTLCSKPGDKFTFNVGYHELEGTKVVLKKPLLVTEKKVLPDDAANFAGPAASNSKESTNVELNVIGIIRHKLLFKNRPKAIISQPETKAKYRAMS